MATAIAPDLYKQFLEKYAMIIDPSIINGSASNLGGLSADVVLTKTKSNAIKNDKLNITVVDDSWDKYYELLAKLFVIKTQCNKDGTETEKAAITELMKTVATETNNLAKSNTQGPGAVTAGTLNNYHEELTNAFSTCATSLGIGETVEGAQKQVYTGTKAFFITLFADLCRLVDLDEKADKLDKMITPEAKVQFAKLKETAKLTFDDLETPPSDPVEMQEQDAENTGQPPTI